MAKILVVDDEKNILNTMKAILQDEGHVVYTVQNGKDALQFVKSNECDVVFLDVWLPDIDGMEVLQQIKQLQNDIAVIMISGHGSIDIAVKSTRLGAFDFLEKPPSMERVITSLNNAIEQIQLKRENVILKKNITMEDEMIGNSIPMQEVKRIIDTAAATNARVFITGENGTGKELVARAIYRKSKRSDKPFIKVNCAAIPDELIESELFGHEKGSFTGALARRLGKFELADKGTIFLDEICDMSQSAQAKVLRVLQEQQFERVGGNDVITVDVRVIAATNVDVKEAIEQGRFREDLYYRLNVIPIYVPPLSERKDDIPLLVDYFLEKFAREHGLGVKQMSDSAMHFMVNYAWPGNVRELKNVIERLTIMVPSEVIELDDIKKHIESYDYEDTIVKDSSSLKKAREQFEKEYIIKALKQFDKNVSATAKSLGIERTNLHRKIRQYHINVDKL
ncbi:MAG TPA: sigma-54 dependent transcriptional regulator [Spirochaetota bacterium]|nr:sigma-54 dependent transcriptional regulator [Spirochaetota bacterium]HOT18925.1 sigma-54 dependent transcriptional regulator [Spirochaetota bacterium]HPD05014.1 sigma-54 dependent transcriptional regulator [Spirochaetota bacterium]HQG42965.1 sigma-54 dependent transcriptional regulator [Spirochaetota bacterium]HRR60644.1 sigma-54 dependent transcriptional regulator [Spirochaetota bacterium]